MEQLRNRKGRCLRYWPWNKDAEAGDYMVDHLGQVFRLVESNGWAKRAAGELTAREIKPPQGYVKGILSDGKIFWITSLDEAEEDGDDA